MQDRFECPRRHLLAQDARCVLIGIAGVDTRSITKRLRERGALRGVISTELSDPMQLVARAKAAPEMRDQIRERTTELEGQRKLLQEQLRQLEAAA